MRPVEDEQEEDNFGGDDGEEFVLVQLLAASQGPDSTGWRVPVPVWLQWLPRGSGYGYLYSYHLLLLLAATAKVIPLPGANKVHYRPVPLACPAVLASIWRGQYGKRGCISKLGHDRTSLPGDRWPGAVVN